MNITNGRDPFGGILISGVTCRWCFHKLKLKSPLPGYRCAYRKCGWDLMVFYPYPFNLLIKWYERFWCLLFHCFAKRRGENIARKIPKLLAMIDINRMKDEWWRETK